MKDKEKSSASKVAHQVRMSTVSYRKVKIVAANMTPSRIQPAVDALIEAGFKTLRK